MGRHPRAESRGANARTNDEDGWRWREERASWVLGVKGRLELLMGIEPMTSSLPRKCSTTELQQQGQESG